MIIGHFFVRVNRHVTYLMCETTCSGESKSSWKDPVRVFALPPGRENPLDWIEQAKRKLLKAHPGYVPGEIAVPGRGHDGRCFDIVLNKKPSLINVIRSLFK